ncbi:MAG: Rdx family protein [Acidobacteriia bacterium]|nr:Rdx family protein [Terriglobia bacterium]
MPARLKTGGLGAFDVYVDGEKIYSKKQTGRMPTSREIIHLIREKK